MVLTSYCPSCGRTVYLERGDEASGCPVCSTSLLPVDGWDPLPFEERIATNEARARSVNEGIEPAAITTRPNGELEFHCECGDSACNDTIKLTIREYEAVRARPTRFAVAPGHEIAEVEAVVERGAGYQVVEKLGRPAVIARERDPRR